MQKVVSISLNGIAYQLEEPGYEQLRAYLERAEARLRESPDRAEVMGDLEQAIGEKCARALGPHKTVVSTLEIDRILAEMGPVESPDAPAGSPDGAGTPTYEPVDPPRKRLFKIREGEMFGGVCNGIAAYTNVDVTWIRIGVVLLTIFTTGVVVLAYLALMFIVPYAVTSEERAAAFGAPFSTAEFLGSAKKKPDVNGENLRWRREWRRQQRNFQRQLQHMNEQMRHAAANAAPYVSQTGRAVAGVFVPLAAIVGAILFVAFILALISLIAQHNIYGWDLPFGMPLWVAVVGLVLVYTLASSVVRFMRSGAVNHPGWAALHTVIWICCTLFLFWVAYTFVPGVHELVDQMVWAADLTVDTLSRTLALNVF